MSLTTEKRVKSITAHAGKKRILFISVLAIGIAIMASIIARGLIYLINLFTNISFYGHFSFIDSSPADNSLGWWVIFVPAIGGFIVGHMAYYGSKAIRGHGIPEAMEQILTNQSKISPAITWLKPLSSAISIGTGGPFGAEGPIIATGGALGSTIGQLLKISDQERKILLAAGAAAGMSAIFDSPVAAIFLAIELLLFEFSPRSVLPVALACITGAAGHHLLFKSGYVFPAPLIETPGSVALALYTFIGILTGVVAALITKSVYLIEDGFEHLPVHWIWWPALGGLVVGIIGKFMPRTLGVGYENITEMISGTLTLRFVLMLCIMKFVSWAFALGSGTSGGTLAPLLTIGSATGMLFGMLLNYLFPNAGIALPVAALIGMSAMFAGASRALLTSIVFALETTGQLHALLPLLSACTASYLVSYFLMEHTIMTEKIARRGINTPHSYQPDFMERVTTGQVMTTGGITIKGETLIDDARKLFDNRIDTLSNYFIVIDNEGGYMGIISFNDLYIGTPSINPTVKSLIKSGHVVMLADSSLKEAVGVMTKHNLDVLPIKQNKDSDKIAGLVTYKNIITAYGLYIHEYQNTKQHIYLKRRGMKILVQGQNLLSRFRIKKVS